MKFRSPMSNKHRSLLSRASVIASTSEQNFKHGAILTKGGSVISVGINRRRTNPALLDQEDYRLSSVHAEVAAIKGSHGADLKGAVIYVARVNNAGEQMMSKPCEECQKVLRDVGVKKVFYTIDSSMTLEEENTR